MSNIHLGLKDRVFRRINTLSTTRSPLEDMPRSPECVYNDTNLIADTPSPVSKNKRILSTLSQNPDNKQSRKHQSTRSKLSYQDKIPRSSNVKADEDVRPGRPINIHGAWSNKQRGFFFNHHCNNTSDEKIKQGDGLKFNKTDLYSHSSPTNMSESLSATQCKSILPEYFSKMSSVDKSSKPSTVTSKDLAVNDMSEKINAKNQPVTQQSPHVDVTLSQPEASNQNLPFSLSKPTNGTKCSIFYDDIPNKMSKRIGHWNNEHQKTRNRCEVAKDVSPVEDDYLTGDTFRTIASDCPTMSTMQNFTPRVHKRSKRKTHLIEGNIKNNKRKKGDDGQPRNNVRNSLSRGHRRRSDVVSNDNDDAVTKLSTFLTDEEYARQLQDEFDKELQQPLLDTNDLVDLTFDDDDTNNSSVALQSNSSVWNVIFDVVNTMLPARRNRRRASSTPSYDVDEIFNSYEALSDIGENIGDAVESVLSKEELVRLPTRTYNAKDDGPKITECPICMSEYKNREKVKTLCCFHEFHSHCIDKWLKSSATCPVCRIRIKEFLPPA